MVVLLPDSLKEAANVKSERTTLGDSTHSVLHLIIHYSDGLHVLQLFNVNGLLSDSMSYRVRRSMKLHVKQEEKYEAVCKSSCILVFVEPLCIHRFVCVSMWISLCSMSVPESFNTVTFGGLTACLHCALYTKMHALLCTRGNHACFQPSLLQENNNHNKSRIK